MVGLRVFCENDMLGCVVRRVGETKLGEQVLFPRFDWQKEVLKSSATFVLLGVPEDIGVRANGGIGGAHTNWPHFVKSFLNIQETKDVKGEHFFLLGHFDFSVWMEESKDAEMGALRKYTANIDEIVAPVIEIIVASGKIPIIIGGGHNNAYPILKGASTARKRAINAINLDAHSDFRVAEGRHSGNGFRYAYEAGFLKKYSILGLHQAYNSNNIMLELNTNDDFKPIMWEDVFLRGKFTWLEAITDALNNVAASEFGVELDVDCIENVLSSAATPVGVTSQQAMQYLYQCGLMPYATYLHLPEAVSKRADGLTNNFTGKLLSYLVQGFARGVMDRTF